VIIRKGVRIRNIHRITLGRNVEIGDDVFIQAGGGLTIGDDTLLGPGVKIWTQNHRYADPEIPVSRQGADYAAVSIGPDCWLGANSIILPGVHLPRGCVVAAGSVVGIRAYREYQLLMGYPARAVGSRMPAFDEQPVV
jgi:acetyltransferase-like isoleucine patch superfamily enzyme